MSTPPNDYGNRSLLRAAGYSVGTLLTKLGLPEFVNGVYGALPLPPSPPQDNRTGALLATLAQQAMELGRAYIEREFSRGMPSGPCMTPKGSTRPGGGVELPTDRIADVHVRAVSMGQGSGIYRVECNGYECSPEVEHLFSNETRTLVVEATSFDAALRVGIERALRPFPPVRAVETPAPEPYSEKPRHLYTATTLEELGTVGAALSEQLALDALGPGAAPLRVYLGLSKTAVVAGVVRTQADLSVLLAAAAALVTKQLPTHVFTLYVSLNQYADADYLGELVREAPEALPIAYHVQMPHRELTGLTTTREERRALFVQVCTALDGPGGAAVVETPDPVRVTLTTPEQIDAHARRLRALIAEQKGLVSSQVDVVWGPTGAPVTQRVSAAFSRASSIEGYASFLREMLDGCVAPGTPLVYLEGRSTVGGDGERVLLWQSLRAKLEAAPGVRFVCNVHVSVASAAGTPYESDVRAIVGNEAEAGALNGALDLILSSVGADVGNVRVSTRDELAAFVRKLHDTLAERHNRAPGQKGHALVFYAVSVLGRVLKGRVRHYGDVSRLEGEIARMLPGAMPFAPAAPPPPAPSAPPSETAPTEPPGPVPAPALATLTAFDPSAPPETTDAIWFVDTPVVADILVRKGFANYPASFVAQLPGDACYKARVESAEGLPHLGKLLCEALAALPGAGA